MDLCINITQINFQKSFKRTFTKHVQTHNYPTRNAQDYYSINKQRKCFQTVLLDKNIKQSTTIKAHQALSKSVEISSDILNTNDFFFRTCLCVVIFICVHFVMNSFVNWLRGDNSMLLAHRP